MKWLSQWRANRKRNKRISAAKAAKSPLREFVYLDEVSVYSLLTSRHGAPVAEYTDSSQTGLKSEVNNKLSANATVVKGEIGSKIEGSRSWTSQALRKSTVQSAFRELYEGEKDRLAFGPLADDADMPEIDSWQTFSTGWSAPEFHGWVVDPVDLARGRLIEVEVELEAEGTYRFSSVITALLEMIEENRELLPTIANVAQVAMVNRIFDRMMVGLVPLKCRLVDYSMVEIGERRLLVHDRLLEVLRAHDSGLAAEQVLVVGVTEQNLYWKDVRRVLFTGSRFRALCRLNQNGFTQNWTPVKLADLLDPLVPDLSMHLQNMSNMVWNNQQRQDTSSDRHERVEIALNCFGRGLVELYGASWPLEGRQVDDLLDLDVVNLTTVDGRREAFATITRHVSTALEVDPDPTILVQLRTDALLQSGLGLEGRTPTDSSQPLTKSDAASTELMFDTEFVAIYW